MIGTKGRFDLNDRWEFGWDVLAQTDKNFAYTYGIDGYQNYYRQNADLPDRPQRPELFRPAGDEVQRAGEHPRHPAPSMPTDRQAALGAADARLFLHARRADLRRRAQSRREPAVDPPVAIWTTEITFDGVGNNQGGTVRGIEGSSTRLTGEAEWKRSFITDGGLVVTPLLAFQADATGVDQSAAIRQRDQRSWRRASGAATDLQSAYSRMMATAGMELRWPVLFASANSIARDRADGAGLRPARRGLWHDARHPQRGCAELRVRCLDAVRARQVLRL